MARANRIALPFVPLALLAAALQGGSLPAGGAEPEPALETMAAEPLTGGERPVWRIGDSRDLWSRCRVDGFLYPSWSGRYELSSDGGRSWQPLTREASRGCHFDWLVRPLPAGERKEPADGAAGVLGLSPGKPYDLRASVGSLSESDFLDVGAKYLITPDLGVDAAFYYGDALGGGALTIAARSLLGIEGLDLTLSGGAGQRTQSAPFGAYGRHDFTTRQEAYGGLLQYIPAAGAPLHGIIRGMAGRSTESGTRDSDETFTRTDDAANLLEGHFQIAGGVLRKQEFAALTPFGLSLSLNDESLRYSDTAEVESGLETLAGYHTRSLPGGTKLDAAAGYAQKGQEFIYDLNVAVPAFGGELAARAESTPVTRQQQLSYSYGHCGLSLYRIEYELGPEDDGFMISCGLLGAPQLVGPGFGTQLAADLSNYIDRRGTVIADPVRGADIYSLLHAGDRYQIREISEEVVGPGNQPPLARISGVPPLAAPGARISADGSSSSDAEGPIATYSWSAEGPCTLAGSSTAAAVPVVVSETAADGAVCLLRLTVRDQAGLAGSAEARLRVQQGASSNQPPTARITGFGGAALTPGASYFADGSSSSDPEGAIAAFGWSVGGACSAEGATGGPTVALRVPVNATAGSSCTVTLEVTDAGGLRGTTSVTAQVATGGTGGNQPPTARIAGLPAKLGPGRAYSLSGTGSSDTDGTVVSWFWRAAGDCTLTGAATLATTEVTAARGIGTGSCVVYLTVTDDRGSNGATAASAVMDRPPTVLIDLKGTPLPGSTLSATALASDPDGQVVGYLWSVAGPCTIGDGSASVNVQVNARATPGDICTLGVTVTDDDGATGSASRGLTVVRTANQPPVARIRVTGTPTAGRTFTAAGDTSSDPDGAIAGYQWSTLGHCAVAGSATGSGATIQVDADAAASDSCTVRLTVTDNEGAQGSASQSLTLLPNQPPVARPTIATGAPAAPGGRVSVAGNASDPDGRIVAYQWSAGPDCSVTGSASGANVELLANDKLAAGASCIAQLKVWDDVGATGSGSVQVALNIPVLNQPPVARPTVTTATPADPGSRVGVSAGASDADGTVVSYLWSAGPNCTVAGSSAGANAVLIVNTALAAGASCVATVQVLDDKGASGSGSVDVPLNIPPANLAPIAVITRPGSGTLGPGQTESLSGAGSSDSDGRVVAHSWAITSGDCWLSATSGTTVTLGTPTAFAAGASCKVELTVTDNGGARSAPAILTVDLNYPPTTPVITIPATTLYAGRIYTATGSASDSDGRVNSWSWRASGLCSLSGSGSTATVAIDPTASYGDTCVISLRVSDNDGVWSNIGTQSWPLAPEPIKIGGGRETDRL